MSSAPLILRSPEILQTAGQHPALILIPSDEESTSAFATSVAIPIELLRGGTTGIASLGANPALAATYLVRKRSQGAFPDRIGIGRSGSVDVSIKIDGISKYHAYITKTDSGYALVDASSKNGTWASGVRVTSKPHELVDWTEILLGATRFMFLSPKGMRKLVDRI